MQDPYLYSQIKAQVQPQPQFPEQEHLKCPRCDSTSTKFCYYNNYNLSQPRYFCKNCKRYWTKGGSLRNIPVGGGSRKNTKRSSSSAAADASSHQSKRHGATSSGPNSSSSNNAPAISESEHLKGENYGGQFGNMMEVGGNFSSFMESSGGHFSNFLDGLGTNGSTLQLSGHYGGPGPGPGSISGHNLDPQGGLGDGSGNNGCSDPFFRSKR